MERLRRGSWQRRALFGFLALCVLWIVGVAVWFVVALVTPPPPEPWEDEERAAGLHHEQVDAARFYVPEFSRTEKNGTVVLRYKVRGQDDSTVADFLWTYDITVKPEKSGPNEETYRDRFGEARRTFTVVYEDAGAEIDDKWESSARITVRAVQD
ncbi:hypothetical protein RCO28_29640 [Streptomyces sp. LHD-70]|uniref:hypothetical protein n=1 Tax=Streptomyces sp. LHD-70 TaxID=3072140 RepID=UPI00280C4211|nr:hypothetical protein [Streptomyces sp. LHD-70]MDQ8706606.1 hypothetical protein [Streptomyces sp. LHD-70]